MKHIKKFNESKDENPLNYLKDEIIDILQDSFLDNGIPVEVDTKQPAQVRYNTIERRQSIYVYIGNNDRDLPLREYISLRDKWEDLKRLFNWAKTENLVLKNFKIYGVLAHKEGTSEYMMQDWLDIDVDVNKWDGISNLHYIHFPRRVEKYKYIQINFENLGWQTSHKLAYGDPITNQIVQEYELKDMNQMTDFISESMKIFESQNHHPHYFHWSGSKLFISLKTHSSNSVTQKDWDLASKLDLI